MKPARNDPCSCGSGKKFKHCCEGKAASRAAAPPDKLNQLVALYNARRYTELESHARLMVGRYPDSGLSWKLLGAALQMQGKETLSAFQKAAKFMPRDGEAHNNLGLALQNLGRLEEAESSYQRALAINPDSAVAHYNLGNVQRDLGQLDKAAASYRHAIKIKPDFAEAHNNLGLALQNLGQFESAVASCSRALEIKPGLTEAHFNLGHALLYLGNADSAVNSFRRAIQTNPVSAELHSNLGHALKTLDLFDEAAASFHQALEIDPKNIGAMLGLGYLHAANAEIEKTEEMYGKILTIDVGNLDAQLMLVNARKVRTGDESLTSLVASEAEALNPHSQMPYYHKLSLQFALGKCFDDLGEHDQAFPHFLAGCKLKRATFQYDAAQVTQHFDNVIRVFDRATLERLRGAGNTSTVPIFVLGMPRSGTTLTEQILASHPEVYGAGELPDMLQIAQRTVGHTPGFPANITALDSAGLTQWGDDYVAALRRHAPDARHVTDKLPSNFQFVGLIHVMLPNARIIHVNRNPVDTCLSCFTTLFTGVQNPTYDLTELGRYYVDYARLMEHWRHVLPADAFLDVQYEDIVANQEVQARRLLAFCGLEWNDACLDFHNTKRSVNTASMTQVRQPIYRSSVERWRPYEKYLGPLLDALGDLAPKRNPDLK